MIISRKFSLNWLGSLKVQFTRDRSRLLFLFILEWIYFCFFFFGSGGAFEIVVLVSMSLLAQAFDFPNSYQTYVSPKHLRIARRVEAKWVILELSWGMSEMKGWNLTLHFCIASFSKPLFELLRVCCQQCFLLLSGVSFIVLMLLRGATSYVVLCSRRFFGSAN